MSYFVQKLTETEELYQNIMKSLHYSSIMRKIGQ